jgi:prophage tail gpP-like protein
MSRIIIKNVTTGKELLWRHIKIRKSLDNICHTLEVEIAPAEHNNIHKHDKIEARYQNQYVRDSQEEGGRRVTTVLVDEITAVAEPARRSLSVMGRSPARDIIDSVWSGDLNDMNLLGVTKQIGGKFGIDCFALPKGTATDTVPAFRFENESPWGKLVGEADNQGFILTSNEAGSLYLWKAAGGEREEGFTITEGGNIKTIQWTENGAEQYHEYIITGGGLEPAKAVDNTVKNKRVLTVNITDPDITFDKLKRRAETEMRRRKEKRVIVTVPGWGLTDRQIKRLGAITAGKEIFWTPNILIRVILPSLGLDSKLLISEVEQEAGPETMSSTITLVIREAYL